MQQDTKTPNIQTCWILTEGIAGTENQCLGVAESLGVTPIIKRIKLRAPWKQLSPWLSWGHDRALAKGSDDISAPYPDLLIASGRKSIGLALHIKKLSLGKTFVVQIQDPRINPKKFDLVVVPQHDPTRGDNVLVTKAALHRITQKKIDDAKAMFEGTFKHIPHPRVAVLIGGSSRAHSMTLENCRMLATQLMLLAENKKIGLIITASRRTGEENAKYLRDTIKGPQTYFWDNAGDNPYFGLLAHADYIIVTEDSVSMTSEALATGKPVYIASLAGGAARLDAFHKLLQEQGYTRPFIGLLDQWSYTPPDDTMRVTQEILEQFAKKANKSKRKK